MRILMTGGAGFIGTATLLHLLESSPHELLNFDALTYAADPDIAALRHPRHHFWRGDSRDAGAVRAAFARFQPDAVLHLAAETHVDRSIDGPAEFLQTNVVGTFNLLQAALDYWRGLDDRARAGFRFLHVSTDEVFGELGPDEAPFSEARPYAPSSPYSASKAASDHLVRAWHRTYGLPTIVSHCSNNYGPRQFPEKLIPLMILNAVEGRRLPVYGDGLQVRDWLFVDDHAEALCRLLARGKVGETYNIGGRSELTNIEVVQSICAILEEERPQKPAGVGSYADLITSVADRPGHDRRYAIDDSKISRELGWAPRHMFQTGLRATVRWYLDNLEWCERIRRERYDRQRIGLSAAEADAA